MDFTTCTIIPRLLHFKKPAGTSRAILRTRQVYFIVMQNNQSGSDLAGWGEIAPLDGLSPEDEDFHQKLKNLAGKKLPAAKMLPLTQQYPSFRFGWEAAKADLKNGGKRIWFDQIPSPEGIEVPINGLIWMRSEERRVGKEGGARRRRY